MQKIGFLPLAAALLLIFPTLAASQKSSARVTTIYSSVSFAWARALQNFATRIPAGYKDQSAINLKSLLSADMTNPSIRAGLAPVVMNLEAKGLTPERATYQDFESAEAAGQQAVKAERDRLVAQAKSISAGRADLPQAVAKLYMLQGVLAAYLPYEKASTLAAYQLAHSKLSKTQEQEVEAALKRILRGLESATIVEALSNEAVPAGPVEEKAFARKIRLTKPTRGVSK
jgi:hypothetical protein